MTPGTPSNPAEDQASVRVRYFIRRAKPRGGDVLQLRGRPGGLEVEFSLSSTTVPGVDGKVLAITATAAVRPPSSVHKAMTKLADGTGLGEGIADFGSTVSLELATAMKQAVELLRWRNNAAVPNHPFEYLGAEFSIDHEESWVRLPVRTTAAVRRTAWLQFDDVTTESAQTLIDESVDEPVAHHLLREAFDVGGANPRSAIVIGVAAIESGFKQLVQQLIPAAGWLMEKMPSPPVTKMLAEFMPTLPAANTFDGVVHPPPKYARKIVAEAVEQRNLVAHTGAGGMTAKDLVATLECFRDLLYLFDFYAGHAWARSHLSDRFVTALAAEG